MKKLLEVIIKISLFITGCFLLLFILGYVLTMGEYPVAKTVDQDLSLPALELDGYRFHLETFGSPHSPVVIGLHGGPGNDYRYLYPLTNLADDYFLVLYDQRGTGLSPRVSKEEHSLQKHLVDLDVIVNHFGKGKKVHLLGHSWGAMLASGYICEYPDRVSRLVLAEPGFLNPKMAESFQQRFKVKGSIRMLWHIAVNWFSSLHVHGPDKQAKKDYLFSSMMTYEGKGNPMSGYFCNGKPDRIPMWRYSMLGAVEVQQKGMDENGNFNINLIPGKGTFPGKVLFLAGECNSIIGSEHQEQQVDLFENAELVTIPEAGHMMFSDQPEKSLVYVREYFSGKQGK